MKSKKVTIPQIQSKKINNKPITMLTAYDYPIALACDQAEIDIILVGDSYGMIQLGYESTIPVTMEEMIIACKAVARGAKKALLIGDMPFMSYQANAAEAIRNAGKFLKQGGMDAVKLEGGSEISQTIGKIVDAGIAVQGHIGLTPQSIGKLGGHTTQGTTAHAAGKLLDDALILEDSGCFAIVLEKIPSRVAKVITDKLTIPTIGIGAGVDCDGQVLVTHDILGLFNRFTPKFVKQYTNLGSKIDSALASYKKDVEQRSFPAKEHSFLLDDGEWEKFMELLDEQNV